MQFSVVVNYKFNTVLSSNILDLVNFISCIFVYLFSCRLSYCFMSVSSFFMRLSCLRP